MSKQIYIEKFSLALCCFNVKNSSISKIPFSISAQFMLEQFYFRHIQDTRLGEGSYPSAVVQSVYFTAPTDWAKYLLVAIISWFSLIRRGSTC